MKQISASLSRMVGVVFALLLISSAAYAISSVDQGFQAGWFVGDGKNVTNLNASQMVNGILAVSYGGTGASDAATARTNLDTINATTLTTGTLPDARLSSSYAKNAAGGVLGLDASGNTPAYIEMAGAVYETSSGISGLTTSDKYNWLYYDASLGYLKALPGYSRVQTQNSILAGANISIAQNANGTITITSSGGGSGGGNVTAVTGSGNIYSSGGVTPDISFTGQLPVANGGTGASTAAGARTNLGISGYVVPGTNTLSTAAAAAADGDTLYLIAGTYTQTIPVDITSKSLSINGAGNNNSIVIFTGSNGFVASTGSNTRTVTIRDMKITTNNNGGYTAIQLQAPASASTSFRQFLVDNVVIMGTVTTNYWTTGIQFIDAWDSTVSNVHIRGYELLMANGIQYNATAGYSSTDNYISNSYIFFADTGIKVNQGSEGIHINDNTIVYVNQGIWWNMTSALPMLNVQNTHIAAFKKGIYAVNVAQASLIGNLIYKRGDSSQNFVGIELVNANTNRIIGNQVTNQGTGGTAVGIYLNNSGWNTVGGNTFGNQEPMISLANNSGLNTVYGNTGIKISNVIIDNGTGNVVTGNLP